MRIKFLPENERPVEKALSMGVECLSNAELLALIIHTGTKSKSAIRLAEDILSIFPGGMTEMASCSAEELMKVSGIGKTKASAVLAAIQLSQRMSAWRGRKKFSVVNPADAAGLFMEELRYKRKEYFKSILVNSKGEVISVENVSVGELTSTVVHPREVFTAAIRKSAAAIIFVHNHPSGDPTPSAEDVETTHRLAQSGELLGIKVLDHIIIGDGKFISLRESELFK